MVTMCYMRERQQMLKFIYDLMQMTLNISGLFLVLTMLLMPYAMFSIGRKFDKKFRHVHYALELLPGGSPGRTIRYMGCIALGKKYMNNKFYNAMYQGYDFQTNATLPQKIVSYIYFFFGMIFLLNIIVFGISWVLWQLLRVIH